MLAVRVRHGESVAEITEYLSTITRISCTEYFCLTTVPYQCSNADSVSISLHLATEHILTEVKLASHSTLNSSLWRFPAHLYASTELTDA